MNGVVLASEDSAIFARAGLKTHARGGKQALSLFLPLRTQVPPFTNFIRTTEGKLGHA